MGFFSCLFRRKRRQPEQTCTPPPRPENWNLTLADLLAEAQAGKRKILGHPELDWARDYERSLIPGNMRFPHKGDVYESLQDMEVEFLTAWAAPFTGGGKAMLFQGEQVFIDTEPSEAKPLGSYAKAVLYEELEQRMVSASERTASRYGGFYFYFSTIDLNTKFTLVRSEEG
jgi:hypothetical protein